MLPACSSIAQRHFGNPYLFSPNFFWLGATVSRSPRKIKVRALEKKNLGIESCIHLRCKLKTFLLATSSLLSVNTTNTIGRCYSYRKMIRRGRAEGWLKEPIEKLPSWAKFQGARFNGIKFGLIPGFESRGTGIIAEREVTSDAEVPLMVIPKDLIVSKENIYIIAKSDPHLREVLQALGELGRVG